MAFPRLSAALLPLAISACGDDPNSPRVEARWRYEAEANTTAPGLGPEARVLVALRSARPAGLGGFLTLDERGPQVVEGPFFDLPLATGSAPLIVGLRVSYATPVGRLIQLDLAGEILEDLSLAGSPGTPTALALQGSRIAAAVSTGTLVTLDGSTGAPLFRAALESVPTAAPVFAPDGRVYVATEDGRVRGFGTDGEELFSVRLSGRAAGPAVRSDGALVAGDDTGVRAFDASGAALFERPRPARVVGAVPLPEDHVLVYGEDGAVERLDAEGALVWRFQTASANPPPVYLPPLALERGYVLVLDDAGEVHLVSPSGEPLSALSLGERPAGPAVRGGTGLIFVSVGPSVRALGVVLPE